MMQPSNEHFQQHTQKLRSGDEPAVQATFALPKFEIKVQIPKKFTIRLRMRIRPVALRLQTAALVKLMKFRLQIRILKMKCPNRIIF